MRLITATLFAAGAALVAAAEAPLHSSGDTIDDAYIVKFKDDVSPEDVQQHMDSLKDWTYTWPPREAGNGGIRPDPTSTTEQQPSSTPSPTQGSNNGNSGSSGSSNGGQASSSNDKEHSSEQNNDWQPQYDPSHPQASLDDWQQYYQNVINGLSHAWFYQVINYFGYSGRFSKEVIDRIREDDHVAYVEKDQIVGI